MKLALQLSCYNGGKYLPYLFASLKQQTYQDWHLFVLDNASDAENKLLIEHAIATAGIPVALKRIEKNMGFAGAHNLLLSEFTHGYEAIQLLNDDAVLEPDWLKICSEYLETHTGCAAVSGAVFRWDFEGRDAPDGGRTTIIDTLGLDVGVTGVVQDRGAGKDRATLNLPTVPYEVFGVSGCLPMYRWSAVQLASPNGSLFDATHISYKEDVDLAYRLQARGFTAAVVPTAVAYHRRTLRTEAHLSTFRTKSGSENDYLSYRNHLWVLCKNLRLASVFTNKLGLLPYELLKACYWLARKPSFIARAVIDTRLAWPHLMLWRQHSLMPSPAVEPSQPRHTQALRPLMGQPAKPQVDIAIILVSHNDLDVACMTSLERARAMTTHSTAVVVVDNASIAYRANEFVGVYIPDAWVLLREGDHGYGRSMNRGAAHVEAKYYFILNPDTTLPDPDIFNKLWDYMINHPEAGLVGPRVHGFTGELHDTCRRFPAWYMPFVQRSSLKETDFGRTYLQSFLMSDYGHESERAVDWVQGSAMFVNGDLWRQLGGFDDRYWLYFEDIDLCRRVWLAHKKVVYLPSVNIAHLHGRQSAKIRNLIVNLLHTKESRGHLISWFKYLLKWAGKKPPQHS